MERDRGEEPQTPKPPATATATGAYPNHTDCRRSSSLLRPGPRMMADARGGTTHAGKRDGVLFSFAASFFSPLALASGAGREGEGALVQMTVASSDTQYISSPGPPN
ncbi:hypothetical protein CPLU01_04323 [Colletotrichum plurivorum]|uniref:Uncharacterized protein n=1 Tax=Colletotrichum plurivorum TaxID=2175906 RepID=A0A8H6KPT7_9PEZI|nr:hypothetical protein CPLU01_04323 [Colletotrichum plurivorum]